jgi:hypothetical protein
LEAIKTAGRKNSAKREHQCLPEKEALIILLAPDNAENNLSSIDF